MNRMEPTTIHPPGPLARDEPEGAIPVIREYIGIRPGYCGGRPHILGHRIKVEDVAVWYERMGMSPAEIVDQHPTITLAQVHAALAYFYDHRDEIEAEIREGDEFVEKLRAGQPTIFEKARQRNAENDPVPLHAAGIPHAGIAYSKKDALSIGEILRGLVLIWDQEGCAEHR
jgi:uncharacterized protein (DUF433 family)